MTVADGSELSLTERADHTIEALLESEERLRLAAEAAGVGSWDWHLRSGRVVVSDEVEAHHGFAPGTFRGTYDAYLERIHPADREPFILAIAQAIRDRATLEIEYRITLPGGGMRWVAARGRVQYDEQGQPVRMLGMGLDITERKRNEEALRFLSESSRVLSETLDYETVLQRIAELVVPALADWCAVDLVDSGGFVQRLAVTHADPAKQDIAARLKGYVADAAKAAPVVEVLRSGRSILEPELPDETLVAAAVNEDHLRIMRELRFSSVMIVPLLTLERTLGALTLMSGESGRRYDEADLTLAEDVAKRAALAIDNAVLYREARRVNEKLQEANAAKDEFLGLVTHELKTPITTILGNAEYLHKRGRLADEESEAQSLADMRHDAERLNRVIDNLLVLARIEAIPEVQREPLPLIYLVEKLADEHERRHPGREVVLRAGTELPPAVAHQGHVELILRNLLSNAEKYSPLRFPIEIAVTSGGHETIVTVMDRGIGIPGDEIDSVFTTFYRSRRTPRDMQGFGVGLAVCKRLADAQGGRIWASARDGGGTCFSFALPRPDGELES